MNALEKIKLSQESLVLVAELKSGLLKALDKIQKAKRLNEVVALLKGGSSTTSHPVLTAEGAEKFHADLKNVLDHDVDLTPFERIVNNEITIETLKGAVDSTKQLFQSTVNPPVFLDAIKVVQAKIEDGSLFDSLGADAIGVLSELHGVLKDQAMYDSTLQIVDVVAQTAATSVLNEGVEPTQEQLIENNYTTGHVVIAGLPIAIENPIGSSRSGVDANGHAWQTTMTAHYGYFEHTLGADGDEVDVFVVGGTPHDFNGRVFIIDQIDESGRFDEHKVILGALSKVTAVQVYRDHYDEKFNGASAVVEMSIEDFKKWLASPKSMYDSMNKMLLDSWVSDGVFELLPIKKLDLKHLDLDMKEAKATVKDPIVVLEVNHKYYVVHGMNRMEIARKNGEIFVPTILFNADEGYSLKLIKQAIRKCGNIVHAEALGAIVETEIEKQLAANL